MSKVSVIIAAYNVEKYIAKTMDSVIAQSLEDIEIIVVDDCSTDNTPTIVAQYQTLDNRIKIIRHTVNKGLMKVRKTGVTAATGDYIMFLDGDDSLTYDACEKAYHAIAKTKGDMLQFDVNIVFEDKKMKFSGIEDGLHTVFKPISHKVVSVDFGGLLTSNYKIPFTIWNKIYKRSLCLTAMQYIPDAYVNMSEDVMFSYLVQFHAKTYNSIENRIYNYSYGQGMSTTDTVTPTRLEAIAKNGYVYQYLKSWTIDQKAEKNCEKALNRVFSQLFLQVCDTFFNHANAKQKKQLIEMAQQYCNVEDIVLAFSQYMYAHQISMEKCAEQMTKLNLFSATKKDAVKTIGIYYYRVYNGGVENVISSLSDMWVKNGYKVVLFTDQKPHKNDYYINPSIKRIILPAMSDEKPKTQKKRITEFRKALIENNVDVMVYNAWIGLNIVLDEMIVKSCGIHFIMHTHGLFCCEFNHESSWVSYRASTLNQTYALTDAVVTLTDVDTAWWQALGFRAFKTINPIQLPLTVEPSPLNGKNILLVARIGWEKNIVDALKIMQKVHKKVPDATLTILGKGDDISYVNTVDNYITTHKMKGYVDMAGFDTNVLPYYQKADIFLSTSRFEGFGLALMESKICGMPMVCYELPNLDITKQAKGMRVIPQGDVEAAADAIIEILENDELKKQMGADARESAKEYYSLDLAKHWDEIFAQTMLPRENKRELTNQSPIETAVQMAVSYYSDGLIKHAAGGVPVSSDAMDQLINISRSESYRVGLVVTYIPRKIKQWLQKRKNRKA